MMLEDKRTQVRLGVRPSNDSANDMPGLEDTFR